ncbi:MAG: FAD:protein FMN transferase [Clostridia bacterium]|nr:FAD:protein FMN transferase [Clostridia bacterium]
MKRFLSLLLVLTTLLLCASGCQVKLQKFTDYSFDYFDTVTTIIGFEESQESFNKNCEKIKSWLSEYHYLYDIYTSYNGITNLCTLNQTQGTTQKVDKKIIDLLQFSKELYTKNQKLNVAMGSVLSLWHDYRDFSINNPDSAALPPASALKDAAHHTDFNKVIIDTVNNTVLIKDTDLTLDVGAIGKGFAAEKVAEMMLENDMEGYLLNLGGNVKIVGERKDGEKWKVGIENPAGDEENPYLETLLLSDNMSLVTSGSYQRFFTVDGKNYHHIIDSQTLQPAEYFTSVSILCEDSGLADGLSTLLFCLPYEEGKQIVENTPGVHAMWLTTKGEKLYSKDFKNYIG